MYCQSWSALEYWNHHCSNFGEVLLICDVFVCLSSLNVELVIPATGNVFYAMTSSSVDFLLRRKGGNTPLGSQPISTETSATFPRIKAKGRRLVRTLFWHPIFLHPQWQIFLIVLTWMQGELSQTVNVAFSVQDKHLDMPIAHTPTKLVTPKHQDQGSLCLNQRLHSRFWHFNISDLRLPCCVHQSCLLLKNNVSFPLFQTVCISNTFGAGSRVPVR